jgi:penicillin amidase
MPNQNLLAVDQAGHIGWTVTGAIPRYDDRDQWLARDEVPVLLDPPEGIAWTANNRIVGGRALALLGDGGYDGPQRAASIRDDLRARVQATPQLTERDLLAVQLGDRAAHLDRWRDLLLQVLADDAKLAQSTAGQAMRDEVRNWQGHAAIDSAGYRLVREFRAQVWQSTLAPYVAAAQTRMADADLSRLRPEAAVWRLITERPAALLNPAYPSWDALLSAAVGATLNEAGRTAEGVKAYTWGQRNVLRMRHPLSASLPAFVARWLDAPFEPLPGDREMARVQTPTSGASQRLVVSPGREQDGVFHMPGGQSGHPLSPYYLAGHDDWARGKATPLLPGVSKYQLALLP